MSLVCVHNQPNKAYETYTYRKVLILYWYIEIKGGVVRKCSKDYNNCNPYYTFLPHSHKGIKETLKYGGCMDIQVRRLVFVSTPIHVL